MYISEAHPNLIKKGDVPDGKKGQRPKTLAQRAVLAKKLVKDVKLTMPCVVDRMDNKVSKAYAGRPDRICIVDVDGKVAYYGRRGPGGFKPREANAALKKLLANGGKMATPKPEKKPDEKKPDSEKSEGK